MALQKKKGGVAVALSIGAPLRCFDDPSRACMRATFADLADALPDRARVPDEPDLERTLVESVSPPRAAVAEVVVPVPPALPLAPTPAPAAGPEPTAPATRFAATRLMGLTLALPCDVDGSLGAVEAVALEATRAVVATVAAALVRVWTTTADFRRAGFAWLVTAPTPVGDASIVATVTGVPEDFPAHFTAQPNVSPTRSSGSGGTTSHAFHAVSISGFTGRMRRPTLECRANLQAAQNPLPSTSKRVVPHAALTEVFSDTRGPEADPDRSRVCTRAALLVRDGRRLTLAGANEDEAADEEDTETDE